MFAKGTTLSVTVGAVLTKVLNLTNIKGLEISADDIETTDHDSADNYREFEQGLKDAGGVDVDGNFTNAASQIALKTLLDSGETVAMEIQFPKSLAKWSFNGYVNKMSTEAPYDDKIGFSVSIKVTGKPTLSTGTGA